MQRKLGFQPLNFDFHLPPFPPEFVRIFRLRGHSQAVFQQVGKDRLLNDILTLLVHLKPIINLPMEKCLCPNFHFL